MLQDDDVQSSLIRGRFFRHDSVSMAFTFSSQSTTTLIGLPLMSLY